VEVRGFEGDGGGLWERVAAEGDCCWRLEGAVGREVQA
jgi:hypothetical protein